MLPRSSIEELRVSNNEALSGTTRIRDRSAWRISLISAVIFGDLVLIFFSGSIASIIRFSSSFSDLNMQTAIGLSLPAIVLISLFGGYNRENITSSWASTRTVVAGILCAWSFLLTLAFALKVSHSFSRVETGLFISFSIITLSLWRTGSAIFIQKFILPYTRETVIYVSDQNSIMDCVRSCDILEFINVNEEKWDFLEGNPELFHIISAKTRNADKVILSFDCLKNRKRWSGIFRNVGINCEIIPPEMDFGLPLGLSSWEGKPTIVVARSALRLHERLQKRLLDLFLVLLTTPVTFLLFIFLAFLIKVDSPGPIIFKQQRIGTKNSRFTIYKLRTMSNDRADANGDVSTTRNDSRITRLGSFMRHNSLDELPQLFNVLKGEMSLVGPRPHAIGSRAGGKLFWDAVPDYWQRHAIKPGITGLAQVLGLRGGDIDQDHLRKRVAADIDYANRWSLALDIRILLKTIRVIVHPQAY